MHSRRSVRLSAFLLTTVEAPTRNAPPSNENDAVPVFCPVNVWCPRSGVSHSTTYKVIKEGWLPSIKIGKSRLIDYHRAIEAVREKFGASRAA